MIKNSWLLSLMLLLASVANAQHKRASIKTAMPVTPDPRYFVHCPATFAGGQTAIDQYLDSAIIYPEAAKEANIQGRVVTTFTVDESGQVANIKVLRGIGGGCDEAVKKAVTNMRAWQPATVNGNVVASKYTLMFTYKLE